MIDLDALTDVEEEALASTEVELNKTDAERVHDIINKVLLVVDELSGHPLRDYQRPFAYRVLESLIIEDNETITALWSRQAGKSETIADVVATAVIMLPRLAKIFPDLLGKFAEGLWVGCFAPTDDMSQTLYGRIVTRLTSERAAEILGDPEIDEKIEGRGRVLKLKKCGSIIRRHTCHPKAQIEGNTYHLAVIDECQAADDVVINKSVAPMMAATAGTMVMTGTPTYSKNCFYQQIQYNKRRQTKKNARQNHFQADWKQVAKSYPTYGKFVKKELLRLGEDSDEFKLSYRLVWMLDKGMFATQERLDELGDTSMQIVPEYFRSPVIVGIDPARKMDSTIVTIVWVDWDRPAENGMMQHRILNWLDLTGMDWESQYFRIMDFLADYNVYAIGIDVGGLGDVVASRLKVLMPDVQMVEMKTDRGAQTKRWGHLMNLMNAGLITWPAHSKARRLKPWKKFRQQMEDAELNYIGPHIVVAAPDERDAHDDYVDSLAAACFITADLQMPEVEVSNTPW